MYVHIIHIIILSLKLTVVKALFKIDGRNFRNFAIYEIRIDSAFFTW